MSRAAQILNILEGSRLVAVDELADALNISRRTVAAEIAALQDVLGTSGSIGMVEGRYQLLIADPQRYRKARSLAEERTFNDPSTRVNYIIASLFRALVPLRTEELAVAMSVSRTTVVADLERARAQVAEADLTIEGRPNVGLVLKGPELQQRLYVLRCQLDTVLPEPEWATQIAAAVHATAESLTRDRAREWARWAALALDRSAAGRSGSFLPEPYRALASTPAFGLAARLADALTEQFGIELGTDERIFLTLPVAGLGRLEGHAEPDSELHVLVDSMLQAINKEMAIDLAGSDFLSEFARHISYLINRARYRIWIDDSGVGGIREEYPVAYRMATLAQGVLEQQIGVPVDEAELGFLATYFQVFLEAGERHVPCPPQVVIVAGAGTVRAELVRLQLAKLLPASTQFRIISIVEATPDVLSGVDLVVSMGEEPVSAEAPVLRVTRILDRRGMERQLERMQLRIPLTGSVTGSGSVLAGALDEEHFFVLPAGTDYADAVDYMTNHLEARKLVEAGFGERIRQRESSAGMLLDPWIAFPHATLSTQASVMLSVGVIPRRPDEDGVRIIVLLGVPSDAGRSEGVLVQVYDEVLRLGARRDLLDHISRVTSYAQFYYFLERHPLTERER